MKDKKTLLVVIGLVLGIVGGIFLPGLMKRISFIGEIYINMIKFMIIPIIMTSVAVTMFKSRKLNKNILLKTVLLFIIMFIITFVITSIIVLILKPGSNFKFDSVKWTGEVIDLVFSQFIVNMFPNNIVEMISDNSIFVAIIFSALVGIAATKVKDGEKAIEIIESFSNILYKVFEYIMYLTPLACFSLVGTMIANYGSLFIGMGIRYILVAYLCSIIALIFVMIIPVWIVAKINPFEFIKKIRKVWLMTITTCSSSVTLPTTIKICNEEFNVSKRLTNITVPLGCTINMCGGAVSFALLGIFCMQLFNISITPLIFVQMIISATIINMSAPGIPNGGIVIGATYLSLLGIPLEFIGFYSGIYKLLDMSYTTLNVTGDITANVLMDRYIKNKNLKLDKAHEN